MKLRIKGNSLRLRLSKTEVEKLAADGYLEEHTSFGTNTLTYTLQSSPGIKNLAANYDGSKINVFVPEIFVKDWPENDVTGFDAYMPVNNVESLYILIEKDFKCVDKTTEDQSDNYENPKAC